LGKELTLADEKNWRHFPQVERVFDGGKLPETLEKIERTCRQLDGLIKQGSVEEKARAQAAMTAYGRTLELIKQLSEIRAASAKK
jgi:hypothetical protein